MIPDLITKDELAALRRASKLAKMGQRRSLVRLGVILEEIRVRLSETLQNLEDLK